MINSIFGRLTVLKFLYKDKWGYNVFYCKCSCGNFCEVVQGQLKRGVTRSCGCLKREQLAARNFVHGVPNSNKTYRRWAAMKKRCTNKNDKNYKDYGGRGIVICKDWLEFANFYRDMGDAPSKSYLDRIDNEKGYYKENCRWVSVKESARNRRNTLKIKFLGQTKTLKDWAEELQISYNSLYHRLFTKNLSVKESFQYER